MFKKSLKVCVTGFKQKSIQRHPICLTYDDCDNILNKTGRQEKNYFERTVGRNSAD